MLFNRNHSVFFRLCCIVFKLLLFVSLLMVHLNVSEIINEILFQRKTLYLLDSHSNKHTMYFHCSNYTEQTDTSTTCYSVSSLCLIDCVCVCFLRFSEIRETCALFDTDAKESCLEMSLLRQYGVLAVTLIYRCGRHGK